MKSNKVALIDFDNTLVNFSSRPIFINYVLHYGHSYLSDVINFILKIDSKIRLLTPEKRKIWNFIRLKGIKRQKISELSRNFVFEKLLKQENKNILDRINYHKSMGHLVVISSASFSCYLDLYGEYKGFDYTIGTNLEVKDGKLTGKLIGNENFGIEKAKNILKVLKKENIDWENSYAYSDSKDDLPMINLVGKKYLIEKGQIKSWI